MTLAAALVLVLLHRADGGVVHVAAAQVTSLLAPVGRNIVVHPAARCVLWLTDGRVLSVTEPCDVVRRLLDEATAR